VDVGLEVLNHVKFFHVVLFIFFCSYLWVCFSLNRLFLVPDFPTVVSELRFSSREEEGQFEVLNKGNFTWVPWKKVSVDNFL